MVAQVNSKAIKAGQKVTLTYEGRELEVIVIDPHGLGRNQPLIGFGFRMAERHIGIPSGTLSHWLIKESAVKNGITFERKSLKLPSGKCFAVTDVLGTDNNEYLVIEASDWMELTKDILINPGQLRKKTKDKLINFLCWFAVKELYGDTYTTYKGEYTEADKKAVSCWVKARLAGTPIRNDYTSFLELHGCSEWYEYAYWTDYVYKGLFSMTAKQIMRHWMLIDGERSIARNYIPEAQGLEAIAFCEKQVVELFVDDLTEAHDLAISIAKRKFLKG